VVPRAALLAPTLAVAAAVVVALKAVARILPAVEHPAAAARTKASSEVRAGAVAQPVEPRAVPPARWVPRVAAAQAVLLVARLARWARPVVQLAAVEPRAVAHKAAVRPDPWVARPVVAKAVTRAAQVVARPAAAERMVRKAVVVVAAAVR
jgi:hypothetical protein